MANLWSGLKSLFGGGEREPGPAEKALDGNKETLDSGHWPTQTSIPAESFPPSLLLVAADKALARHAQSGAVLASAKVGKHKVELLLNAGEHAVDLSLRVPTAANQYKEPYIIMEAEGGNSREDAVREINFHLKGRVPDADVAGADWRAFFKEAAAKLDALRKR
jgi:hypothetical protein